MMGFKNLDSMYRPAEVRGAGKMSWLLAEAGKAKAASKGRVPARVSRAGMARRVAARFVAFLS